MKFNRNEKLTLLLLAVLAVSASPFRKTTRNESRDLASESALNIQSCIDRAKNGSTDECEVSQKNVQKRNDRVVLRNLHITNENGKAHLEGTAVAVVKCTECKIEESSSSIDLRAIPVNDIAKIDQYLQQAKSEATKHFNDSVAAKNKELNCEVDDDGDDIADSNTQAKMECFKRQIAKQDGDSAKKKYISKFVEPYFTKNVEQGIAQQALGGNPYAAHNMADQWRMLGLGDNINGKLNLIDTSAMTRIENLNYVNVNNQIAMQYMNGLMSNDPNIRKQALAAYNQAVNMNASNHFVRLMNGQNALSNSLSGMTSSDPTMSALGSYSMMQLNQNVQGMINSNKSLSSTLGPNFAMNNMNSSIFGNSYFGGGFLNGNLLGTGLMGNSNYLSGNLNMGNNLIGNGGLFNDPLSMNSNLGYSSMLNLGMNTGSNWNTYPSWGSNLATDAGTPAQFSGNPTASTSPVPTTNPSTSTGIQQPVRTSQMAPTIQRSLTRKQ